MSSIDQRTSPNPLPNDRDATRSYSFSMLRQLVPGWLMVAILGGSMQPATASEIDGYLEESTTLVARIDLSRLDFPASVKFLREELADVIPKQAMTGFQITAGGVLQSLKDAGVRELYVTVSSVDYLTGQIAVIVPTETPQPIEEAMRAVVAMLPKNLGYEVYVSKGAVVVTTEPVWERISKLPAADRGELVAAIAPSSDEALSIIVNIREELRGEVAAIWPDALPKEAGIELSPRQIMRDIVAWRFSLHTPPQLQAQLTTICEDETAAERISDLIDRLSEKFDIEAISLARSAHQATLSADGTELVDLLSLLGSQAKSQTTSLQQSNNLKQLGLALHNFHATYQHVPPRMTVNEAGEPLLSWRVFLLPYIGEQQLYDQFHLDQPWDSPHNRQLVDRMPAVYRSEQNPELQAGHTLVQVPLVEGAPWYGEEHRLLRFQDITDGTSNTILFVTVPPDKSVVWTRPNDLELNEDSLTEDLFGELEYLHYAFFDASIHTLTSDVDEDQLRALLTHAGGEVIDLSSEP